MLVYKPVEIAKWVNLNYPDAENKEQIQSDLDFFWDAYNSFLSAKMIIRERYGKGNGH